MSTQVALFGAGAAVPAHIANRELNANTLALAGSPSTGKRISIRGKVWRMMVNGKELAKNGDRMMNVVIVRTAPANSRTYYASEYKEGEALTPTCSSMNGIKPDAQIKAPQASSCDKCPQNIAGSGNGEARACRYSRRIAVVLEGDLSGDVYQIQLPATSIFGKGQGTTQLPLEAYARMLAGNKVNVDSVVTQLEFDMDSATPKVIFSPVRYLTPDELEVIEEQGNSKDAEDAIGLSSYQLDVGESPAITEKPISPPPTRQATTGFQKVEPEEPAQEEAMEEVVPEPTKVTKTSPKASNIASVLAQWND